MLHLDGKKIGLLLGVVVFITLVVMPAPEGLSIAGWRVAAVAALMAILWMTEAIPLAATSLIPIVLYPIFGVMSAGKTTANYGDSVIFLFMGGFFLAVTMERWDLHRRIALYTIKIVGTSPSKMIMGFMVATGFLSMWISNTATAVMMVPIGIAVISQITGLTREQVTSGNEKKSRNFALSLMLGIAYSASLGGVATIIGTPPNTIMVGMLEKLYGIQLSFFEWMLFGIPVSFVMLAFTWLLLTKVLFRTGDLKLAGSREVIDLEIEKLGDMSSQEKKVITIAILMALAWISRSFIVSRFPQLKMIDDTVIAITGTVILFMTPSDFKKNEFLLDWKTAVKIPWDICLLFGGGIALANGFSKSGLASYITSNLSSLDSLSMVVFVLIISAIVVFLTEVTSNTATATLLAPVMGAAAIAMGIHPMATMVPACLAASFAFMLPVATPPNAVVFGSGYIRIKDMAYAGFLLNVIGVIVITFFVIYLIPIVWGVDLSVTPADLIINK